MARLREILERVDLRAALRSFPLKPVLAGVAVCCAAAVLLCLFLDEGTESRLAAPAMCLLVVIVTSIYLGRLAGVLGAAAASCVLAVFLYSPFGSLYVEEHAARMMLNFLLIGAVAVALVVPRRPRRDLPSKPPARRSDPSRDVPPLFRRNDAE